MGWSVVEGEGVAEEMGGASADVESLLALMDRLSLRSRLGNNNGHFLVLE